MDLLYRNKPVFLLFLIGMISAHTFRGDNARTGQVNTSITPPLKQINTVTVNALIISSPIVVNDTLYIGARDSSVYAFHNGSQLWKFKTRGWVDASPVYYNGKIYAGSRDGNLYILNASSGDSVGVIANNNAQCSSPIIYDSIIVFGRGGWNRQINAYNVNNGKYVWHYYNNQMVYSSPALHDSTIVYGENGGNLVAVNAYTGALIWKLQTEGGVYLSSPAISGGNVYFSPGGYDKYLYSISLNTGLLAWKKGNSVEVITEPVDQYLFRSFLKFKPETRKKLLRKFKRVYKLRSSQIEALKPLTRENPPNHAFVPLGGNATSSVAVGDSNVFMIHKEYGYPKPRFAITAFDKQTGVERWYFSEQRSCTQLGFCSSPLVIDSVVFFGWGEGKFYALHAFTGTKLWEDSLDGDILSSPAAEGDKIYVATTTGKIVTYVPGPDVVSFKKSTFCYPNPARGNVSHIQIYVTESATVKVTIFNAAEKPVLRFSKELIVESTATGKKYTYNWDIKNVANGVYFALIEVKGSKDKKILKIAVLH